MSNLLSRPSLEEDLVDEELGSLIFQGVMAMETCNTTAGLRQSAAQSFGSTGGDIALCLELSGGLDILKSEVRLECMTSDDALPDLRTLALESDPLVRHALGSAQPKSWSELPPDPSLLSAHERAAVMWANKAGYADALIAPQHRPGAGVGAVMILTRQRSALPGRRRQAWAMLSAAFYRAARRIDVEEKTSTCVLPNLTRREGEVLYWALQGARDKEIAKVMALSPATVTGYLHAAQRKLGVRGRISAARRASELDLLPTPPQATAPQPR